MVIQEGHQVDAPILPLEHEREEVRLPELIGPGTLEPPHPIGVRMRALVHRLVARFVQHVGHG
jgi:hypothetical protein